MYMYNIYINKYIYIQGFPYWEGWGEYPPPAKNLLISCSHSSCTVFVLISYSFETQIMLIFILIDVQYPQNAVFSFENFLNRQNHSSSGTHHLVKKFSQQCSLLIDRKSGKLLKF